MDHLDLYKRRFTILWMHCSMNICRVRTRCCRARKFISEQMNIIRKRQNSSVILQIIILISFQNMARLRVWGSLSMMKGNTPVDLKGKVVSAWNHGWMDVQTCLDAGACREFVRRIIVYSSSRKLLL